MAKSDTTLHTAEHPEARPAPRWRRRAGLWSLIAAGVLALYYFGGALWLHSIDDDPAFASPPSVPDGGSRAVAVAADLIDREINTHRWVANDPFFMPASILDNMPSYQQGIIAALERFAVELAEHTARAPDAAIDPDLEAAAALLGHPGTVWIFDPRTSWAPTASSESHYRRAMSALRSYNGRLARGEASFEPAAEILLATVQSITADLGFMAAAIAHRQANPRWLDSTADNLFYANKGRLYGYFVLLRELGIDVEPVIDELALARPWTRMLDSLPVAASLQPWVVIDGAPDSLLRPSHLTSQGFFALRAQGALQEIARLLEGQLTLPST